MSSSLIKKIKVDRLLSGKPYGMYDQSQSLRNSNSLMNGSSVKMKLRGVKGHPCCVPFLIVNGNERTPLALTCAEGIVYSDPTQACM